jgi:hypothetical protein
MQAEEPYYLKNFARPDLGCNWMGVAGQVFNKDGQVQTDIIIRAGGEIDGNPVVEKMVMPISEPEVDLAYGPGGYELTLADAVFATENEVWIQLFNLEGDPLSEQIFLVTRAECQQNLLLMNFVEN